MRWLAVLALGAALGVAASAADAGAGGLAPDQGVRACAVILNAGSIWAGLAVLCGWLVVRPVAGALAGTSALVAAVAGYYVVGGLAGDRVEVGLAGLSGALRFWVVASVLLGPVLGAVGALSRRRGRLGLAASLVAPAGVIIDMLVVRRLDDATFAVDPAIAWSQTAAVVAAILGLAAVAAAHLGGPAHSAGRRPDPLRDERTLIASSPPPGTARRPDRRR